MTLKVFHWERLWRLLWAFQVSRWIKTWKSVGGYPDHHCSNSRWKKNTFFLRRKRFCQVWPIPAQAVVDHKSAVVAHVAHPPATLKRKRLTFNPLLSAFIKEYSQKDCHIRPEWSELGPFDRQHLHPLWRHGTPRCKVWGLRSGFREHAFCLAYIMIIIIATWLCVLGWSAGLQEVRPAWAPFTSTAHSNSSLSLFLFRLLLLWWLPPSLNWKVL